MPLVIVESPNKCEKIHKALGSDYEVIASAGHIMDLDKKNMGIDVETWTPHYVVNSDKKDVVRNLKERAKEHNDIYIATDSDFEGHCIGFNIRDIIPNKGKNIYRVIYNSLDKPVLVSAFKNPVSFDENIWKAQQARRMTDRLVGFKASQVMWVKGLKKTSAGRVQSTVLKWLVAREKEIRSFVKEEYWSIRAETADGYSIDFYGVNGKKLIPKSQKEAQAIIDAITGPLTITKCQGKIRKTEPLPPFNTAALQATASTAFNWTSQKVMKVAQSLYENALVTYIRSDSVRIEPSKIKEVREHIENKYGKQYLSSKVRTYQNKDSSLDAHEAIRNIFSTPVPMSLGSDEIKLLDLITNRFVASQMASAEYQQSDVVLEYQNGKKKYVFKVKGSVLKFDGFTKIYGNQTKDTILPPLQKGQQVKIKQFVPKQHFTKPPPRFTDASLTSLMEKTSVGRPSTYATVPETLLGHKYVVREGRNLKPTEIGIMVADYLSHYFKDITSEKFTAEINQKMDDIAVQKENFEKVMTEFYELLLQEIETAKKGDSYKIFITELDCPSCDDGAKMTRKLNKSKEVFLGCQNWPTCGQVMLIKEDGTVESSQVETAIPCPECGNKTKKIKGPYGIFLGCEGFPVCKWKAVLDQNGEVVEKSEPVKLDKKCPKCKIGNIIQRDGKFGAFYTCERYPDCKTIVDQDGNCKSKKSKPEAKTTGEKCPKCKQGELLIIKGKFGPFKGCSKFKEGCKYIGKIE